MSTPNEAEQSRYRPIGKHRYGVMLIVSFAAFVLLFNLFDTLPNKDAVMQWGYVLLAIFGILESAWMFLKPERSRDSLDAGQSLRTIRFRASLLLIAWVVLLTFVIQIQF